MVDLTKEPDLESGPSPTQSSGKSPQPASPTPNEEEIPTPESIESTEPNPRKRSPPIESEIEDAAEPSAKRRRVEESHVAPLIPKPEREIIITAKVHTGPIFDDAPQKLLQRSCALVLDHVGFDGASQEALDALCSEVDSYVAKLLSYVTESMLGARRPQPTPVDFEFAMRRAGLTSRLLKPHLNPPVSRTKTQLNYLPADPEEIIPQPVPGLLGKELDGATEKRAKGFIPEHFPGFPSKHTYKATEHIAEREKDPRKIREQATEAARCAEGSLRRLVQVGKAGDGKVPKKISGKGDKQRLNRELWEKAMEDIGASILQPRTIDRMDAKEQNIKVDAGKPYWRKNVARRKVQSSSKE